MKLFGYFFLRFFFVGGGAADIKNVFCSEFRAFIDRALFGGADSFIPCRDAFPCFAHFLFGFFAMVAPKEMMALSLLPREDSIYLLANLSF